MNGLISVVDHHRVSESGQDLFGRLGALPSEAAAADQPPVVSSAAIFTKGFGGDLTHHPLRCTRRPAGEHEPELHLVSLVGHCHLIAPGRSTVHQSRLLRLHRARSLGRSG